MASARRATPEVSTCKRGCQTGGGARPDSLVGLSLWLLQNGTWVGGIRQVGGNSNTPLMEYCCYTTYREFIDITT